MKRARQSISLETLNGVSGGMSHFFDFSQPVSPSFGTVGQGSLFPNQLATPGQDGWSSDQLFGYGNNDFNYGAEPSYQVAGGLAPPPGFTGFSSAPSSGGLAPPPGFSGFGQPAAPEWTGTEGLAPPRGYESGQQYGNGGLDNPALYGGQSRESWLASQPQSSEGEDYDASRDPSINPM